MVETNGQLKRTKMELEAVAPCMHQFDKGWYDGPEYLSMLTLMQSFFRRLS